MSVLSVDDLRCTFAVDEGEVHAVRGVSYALQAGETLAVVGESGSGKSVTHLALMGLLPKRTARVEGEVSLDGEALALDDERAMRSVRGQKIAMIFQDPMSSLNPFLTVERQLSEVLELHEGAPRRAARRRAIEMLERVGIADAPTRARQFPHQFSGGMRQRAMIAMALLCKPRVLIADEPTTALDVTIQAQILDLLRELVEDTGTGLVFITHDLGVVAGVADRALVMYGGRVVEEGPTSALFDTPAHPYTRALLRAVPRLSGERGQSLQAIAGAPPAGDEQLGGCAFHPRCALAEDRCLERVPPLEARDDEHRVACLVTDG